MENLIPPCNYHATLGFTPSMVGGGWVYRTLPPTHYKNAQDHHTIKSRARQHTGQRVVWDLRWEGEGKETTHRSFPDLKSLRPPPEQKAQEGQHSSMDRGCPPPPPKNRGTFSERSFSGPKSDQIWSKISPPFKIPGGRGGGGGYGMCAGAVAEHKCTSIAPSDSYVPHSGNAE